MKTSELKSRDGSRKSRYLNDSSSGKQPSKLTGSQLNVVLEYLKSSKTRLQSVYETMNFLKDTNFQNMLYTVKDGNVHNSLKCMEIVKSVLENIKEEYAKVLKEGTLRKKSSEGSQMYRKKSKSKFDYMQQFARKNSQNRSKIGSSNQANKISDLLSKFKSNRGHIPKKSSFGGIPSQKSSFGSSNGIPFTIVPSQNLSNRN